MPVAVAPLDSAKVRRFIAHYRSDEQTPRARFGALGCVLTSKFERAAQAIKDFAVRDDDVWIITAPKSGTTWTQEMVWLLLNNLDFETAKKQTLFQRSPFLEFSSLVPDNTTEEFLKTLDTLKVANDLSSPRCIKSHLPKDLLPDQLWSKKAKIIYVAREPKDVAVSYYYHEQLIVSFAGEKDFFFECFYEDLVGYCPIWEHVLDFWKMKDDPQILFNTYEEMKKDLPAVIRRTAHFLGRAVSEAQVAALAEHLHIGRMKGNRSVNMDDMLAEARAEGRVGADQAFIRKGAVGEGRREMAAQMAERFDRRTRAVFNDAVGCPWDI